MNSHFPVIVVGAGQAGLSVSYCLTQQGVQHLVLERHRVGHSWRCERWDTFCLVTPNWQCRLPGYPYSGQDPRGFMKRDEIVAYVEDKNGVGKVDAWKKLGRAFFTLGGGVVYAFTPTLAAQANLNGMYLISASGLVIEPSLGALIGF